MYVAVASWDRLEMSPGRSGFDPRRRHTLQCLYAYLQQFRIGPIQYVCLLIILCIYHKVDRDRTYYVKCGTIWYFRIGR